MSTVEVQRGGWLINYESPEGRRTYACENRRRLIHLVERLTGREWSTLPISAEPLDAPGPTTGSTSLRERFGISIAGPLHIYQEV